MPIIVNLDVMMAKRKISLGELAERIDLTPANLSILKQESQGHTFLHPGSNLQRTGLPAGRYIGIQSGRLIYTHNEMHLSENFIPDRCISLTLIKSTL